MSEMAERKNWCCKLECEQEAEWSIYWGLSYEDYTHSCTEHVGELLEPKAYNAVTEL